MEQYMEQQVGFLYVLANSAMPGVVKVGKTTRSPVERASELSGATGLPTPFIVVYEQLFQDCSAAESFVHVYLARQGYRVADNRDFFNAPVNLVVKAISLAPGAMDDAQFAVPAPVEEDDLLPASAPDELDGLSLSSSPASSNAPSYPWDSVFKEAANHYYGSDDYIQDYAEALRLFRQAAKLGSLPAYGSIGDMHRRGEGVREDKAKALDFYKEGARKGSLYCYWQMGMLFGRENNQANADKCFALFLRNMQPSLPDGQKLTELEMYCIDCECAFFVGEMNIPSVLKDFIVERRLVIRDFALQQLQQRAADSFGVSIMRKAIEQLDAM
jgi:hypothetical protein